MIEPKQIIRSNRRTLALTIDENGELIVHAPKSMALFEIFNFIEKKSDLVENKINTVRGTLEKNRQIISYEEIFFLGKRYKVVEVNGLDSAYLTKDSICVEPCKTKKKRESVLKNWFLENTEKTLIPRIEKLLTFMKQKSKSIKIINSKAKWGMCDSKQNLYFNWKLLMLSPELIDYVIVHEISHLIELNHSKKFWSIVGGVIPNYKHLKEVINRCGFLIKIF